MRRARLLVGMFAALGCAEPATPAPPGCLELFGLPEPVFEPGLEPGPGAEVWCGDTPEPVLGQWDEVLPPWVGACEMREVWFERSREVYGPWRTWRYDVAGRLAEVASRSDVSRTRYDEAGRPVLRTWATAPPEDAVLAWQIFTLDGQPLFLEATLGTFVAWEYDADGRLSAWEQRQGVARGDARVRVELAADGMPLRIETEVAGTTVERTTTFDPVGRVFQSTGWSGDLKDDEVLRCDASGRPVERHSNPSDPSVSEAGRSSSRFDEAWRYDAEGRLVWTWNAGKGAPLEERRAYDARGYVLVVEQRVDGEPEFDSRTVTVRDPEGREVCSEQQRHHVQPGDCDDCSGSRDVCWRMRRLTMYDAHGEVTEIRQLCFGAPETEPALRYTYQRDVAGRVTEVQYTGTDGRMPRFERYRYDCPPVP